MRPLVEKVYCKFEGVVAPWCNPLILQPEQSGGVGSSPGRAPPLERHDKGSQIRLGLLYFCDPSAWCLHFKTLIDNRRKITIQKP